MHYSEFLLLLSLELANELISCKLPDSNPELRKIVHEVQRHQHKKSCLKYDGVCRYGFPRLPSPQTLIAKPIDQIYPKMDEKEKAKRKQKASELLRKAKKLLEDPELDDEMTLDDFYMAIGTNEREYMGKLNF